MQRPGLLLGSTLALVLAATAVSGLKAEVGEYELKAEMVSRFPDFVEWPSEEVPEDPEEPLILGVLGSDPLGRRLAPVLRDRPGRPIELRTLESPDQMDECHLVYVSETEEDSLSRVVERAKREHVLTIGGTEGFARRGIHINLFLTEGRVGFEVNRESAAASELRLSSKLLRLARLVEPGS
ncbi:MAG: YfiR family protein [Thermoanaerobaculia bacterium]|nr:YfiR family protein [Thermoanaerobaculia bacterium]